MFTLFLCTSATHCVRSTDTVEMVQVCRDNPGKVFAVHGAASSKKIYVRAVVILESYVYL